MGAGKSSVCRGFVREHANSPELRVPSPTYLLHITYPSPPFPVHHLDLYRVEMGDNETVDGVDLEAVREGVSLLEWPQGIEDRLHPHPVRVDIELEPGEDDSRRITIAAPSALVPDTLNPLLFAPDVWRSWGIPAESGCEIFD